MNKAGVETYQLITPPKNEMKEVLIIDVKRNTYQVLSLDNISFDDVKTLLIRTGEPIKTIKCNHVNGYKHRVSQVNHPDFTNKKIIKVEN